MKKVIFLLLILIFGTSINLKFFIKEVSVEKIDLKLNEEEIAIIFINDQNNHLFMIREKAQTLLLILNYQNINLKELLNKFNTHHLTIIALKDIDINIDYDQKIILKDYYHFNNIEFKLNNNIIDIEYEDNNFCIYIDRVNDKSDFSDCNFIYFYSIHNIYYDDINDDTEIVFYHARRPLPTFLFEEIYKKWINSYTIRDDEFIILKLTEDYYNIIVIPNN